jgi:hypothetical protein
MCRASGASQPAESTAKVRRITTGGGAPQPAESSSDVRCGRTTQVCRGRSPILTRGRLRKSEEDAWSKLSALEPAGPVKRRRIPKIEIQRERRAISKPVHGLKYSDHQETQGHFLQVKADTEIDSDDSLWTTDWVATLERDNVRQDIVQRERRWKRHVLKDVSQRVRERRQ